MQPAELDAVKSSPVCIETLWKLVEIPFMHQAKCVLRFIKKLPGIGIHFSHANLMCVSLAFSSSTIL